MVKQEEQEPPLLSLTIYLFGPFAVHRSGHPIPEDRWRTTAARLLFAYLALHGPTHRETLMELLCPQADPQQAAQHLRNAVREVRAALASDEVRGTACLVYRSGHYALAPRVTYTTDVETFETYLARAEETEDAELALGYYEAAVALYRGEFMTGCYADWVLRERYHIRYLTALEAIARIYLGWEEYTTAAGYGERILEVDRCWEGAHQVLMEVYDRTGRRTAALRQYRALQRCLAEELGVEPGKTSRELYQRIVREG